MPYLTSSLLSKKNSSPNHGCGWRTSCSETLPLSADNDAFIQIKSGTHFPEERKHIFFALLDQTLSLSGPAVCSLSDLYGITQKKPTSLSKDGHFAIIDPHDFRESIQSFFETSQSVS